MEIEELLTLSNDYEYELQILSIIIQEICRLQDALDSSYSWEDTSCMSEDLNLLYYLYQLHSTHIVKLNSLLVIPIPTVTVPANLQNCNVTESVLQSFSSSSLRRVHKNIYKDVM